jgi:AraC-like DNA-binding protein
MIFSELLYITKGSYTDSYRPTRELHKHNFLELHFTDAGSCRCTVGEKMQLTKPGSLVIYNENTFHAENPTEGNNVAFYSVAFSMLSVPGLPLNCLTTTDESCFLKPGNCSNLLRELLANMFRLYKNKRDRSTPVMKASASLLIELILQMTRTSGQSTVREPSASELTAERIRQYICLHYHEPISLEEIAESIHASPSTISHIFRKQMMLSPIQYLNKIRIGEAQTLLCSTEMSVSDIAITVGYNSADNMYLAFRKYVGMSPMSYRSFYKKLQI